MLCSVSGAQSYILLIMEPLPTLNIQLAQDAAGPASPNSRVFGGADPMGEVHGMWRYNHFGTERTVGATVKKAGS